MSRILIVNKFLYPNGGSETYIFKLGEQLQKEAHEVQYFGMWDERNIVGNTAASYTGNMDFHTGKLSKFLYPFKIIYSVEARRAIRRVLDDFMPDVVHLNNFNFQITPSVIYEIRKYQRQTGHKVKIVFTAHDYQLICPNHMLRCPKSGSNCVKCIDGAYTNCIKGRCIHGSTVKSILGAVEGYFYRIFKAYRYIDMVICPSAFLRDKLEHNPQLRGKTILLPNFLTVDRDKQNNRNKAQAEYAVYFGRYSEEKGIGTLLKVCKALPHIPFIFAGKGPLEEEVNWVDNIDNKGFLEGDALIELIAGAKFSIYPSEWYENCPFSVMESIQYGTPVLGADIGGIPELIEDGVTGELFESGNERQLTEKIDKLWKDADLAERYAEGCRNKKFITLEKYTREMVGIYNGEETVLELN